MLWLGPQQRHENVALTVFWAWWWPLVLLGFPFVGRLCVCHLPLHDLWRSHPKTDPVAVSGQPAALAPASGRTMGGAGSCTVCLS